MMIHEFQVPQNLGWLCTVTDTVKQLPYSGKVWRGKVWRIASFRAFGERKFDELIDQPIGYLL